MNRLHQLAGPPDMDGEMPLGECMGLAHALAAASEGSSGPIANDVADAALAMVDMREVGWVVRKGLSGEPPGPRPAILAQVLAKGRDRKEPTVRERADAERSVDELRRLGFDLFREGVAP